MSRSGKISIYDRDDRGILWISFPRSWALELFGKPQRKISLNLAADNDNDWITAKYIVKERSCDYEKGCFDKTLVKYGLGKKDIPRINQPLTQLELWDKYVINKLDNNQIHQTTFNKTYLTWRRWIEKAGSDDPIAIVNYLTSHYKGQNVKLLLRQLELMWYWGQNRNYIPEAKNPYGGLSQEYKVKKSDHFRPKALTGKFGADEGFKGFTLKDRDLIIEAFRTSKIGYVRHYTDYVITRFHTGARPGEVAGLDVRHIAPDFSSITFNCSYSEHSEIIKTTKNEKIRVFPVNSQLLKDTLIRLVGERTNGNELLFTDYRSDQRISNNRFRGIWREYGGNPGVVLQLANEGKISYYLKPYSTRHTFCSIQANIGKIDRMTLAYWVGDEPETVEKYYQDRPTGVLPADI